ncbi:DMT family transporter [bacterium]|nr:DMT family transporter [bacterium]MBU1637451.1 DMT family transporter [bacterium]
MIQWTAFLYLGVIAWGTSFLWIKIALRELDPLTLVMWRVLFGVITVGITILLARKRIIWKGRQFWIPALLGITGTAIPISMISWAELRIDSGIAGILNGTMPIWTILIAHFAIQDDRLTLSKISGILIGFAGMYLLLNPDVGVARDVVGQLAVVAAAMLYAASTVMTKRYLRGVHSQQITLPSLLSALALMLVLTISSTGKITIPHKPMTWIACGWMGIVGMGLAQQVWFWLIGHWSASRLSMVTYVFPVAALTLGVIFLGERVSWELIVGGGMIIGGIILVNRSAATRITPIIST